MCVCLCVCVCVSVCVFMFKERELVLRELLETLELTTPPPYPLLKRTFLLPSGSVYQGLHFRIVANELCVSVLLPWVTHLFLLMSNLGFSLRYLPFGRPACCCSVGTALSDTRLCGATVRCMDGLFDQI